MEPVELAKNEANWQSLSPIPFLERASILFPEKIAIVDDDRTFTWSDYWENCKRLASGLSSLGLRVGETVSVLLPNSPEMLECHFGVPMCGGVLNTINYRLDPDTIAFILKHGDAAIVIVDREFFDLLDQALSLLQEQDRPTIICVESDLPEPHTQSGIISYSSLLYNGDPASPISLPEDEWNSICLNYTSGTTGNPKGVVYHHRGAYLSALGNALTFSLTQDSVYLWTLPMFHCNGWSHIWSIAVMGGTHICLRKVEPRTIFSLIERHRVTHMCGAPVVLNMLASAEDGDKRQFSHVVNIATGGAPPPSSVISAMETMGFRVTHLYGLTESYGPSSVCVWQDDWQDLDTQKRAEKIAYQGVRLPTDTNVSVRHPETAEAVPQDGVTTGEIMIRSNGLMKGYFKNPEATAAAFSKGWFHSGDVAVCHPNGYIQIKDRSKDIIISGGENISSVEIEEHLFSHPAVHEVAVVAKPDEKWGETPCAFIQLKPDHANVSEEDITAWCREKMAGFKVPKTIVFEELPKTATGKVQKFALRERAAQFD